VTRIMYDAVTASNVPASATLVAGYGDGYYNNVAEFRARFPHAIVVEIAVSSHHNLGVVLDVETGDATPTEAPGWVTMRRSAGVDPTIYCNSSTWPSVRAAFKAAGVAEPHWWIAQYDGDPSIFPGAVAKQYADPGPYDLSSVADYWPGVDPQEPDMPMTPADVQLFLNTTIASPFRKDAAGKPAQISVGTYLTYMDKHFDDTVTLINSVKAQNVQLATAVAALSAGLAKVAGGGVDPAVVAADVLKELATALSAAKP
jgi:hypothetical protein